MQLIDADKARPGLTIVARSQSGGKGQRGRTWVDEPGQSLLMSVIVAPVHTIREQSIFNATVATAIANVLQNVLTDGELHIKWPNDIIINDKKAGGILIENVIRGSRWTHSVVGLGLNVGQVAFPEGLPFATSLRIATGSDLDMVVLRDELISGILQSTEVIAPAGTAMARYNELLYKRGRKQAFSKEGEQWEATILGALDDGTLQVQLADGSITNYRHGEVLWDWS